jgi:hypothetical protein
VPAYSDESTPPGSADEATDKLVELFYSAHPTTAPAFRGWEDDGREFGPLRADQ